MRGEGRILTVIAGMICLCSSELPGQALPRWKLVPEVRFGQTPGKEYEFSRVLGLAPGRDGTVYVADSRNMEVAVFDAAGGLVRRVGRPGRGPGEFQQLSSMGLVGDTLWVIDLRELRTSFFARDGSLTGTTRTEINPAGSQGWFTQLDAILPGGEALGSNVRSYLMEEEPTRVFLMDRSARIRDTLALVPRSNSNFVHIWPDGNFILLRPDRNHVFGVQPFTDRGLTVLAPGASRLFVIDRTSAKSARNADYSIVSVSSQGDTIWRRSFAYTPKPFKKVIADSMIATMERNGARSRNGHLDIRSLLFVPDFYTPITAGIAATDGSLWLRREDSEPNVEYSVIDSRGALVAALSLPARLTLLAATSTHVFGVELDEYDVPQITRYRIVR